MSNVFFVPSTVWKPRDIQIWESGNEMTANVSHFCLKWNEKKWNSYLGIQVYWTNASRSKNGAITITVT